MNQAGAVLKGDDPSICAYKLKCRAMATCSEVAGLEERCKVKQRVIQR
jgi:hypothetical protein